jgi:hypothetical protein
MMRPRLAPSALRTATSQPRVADRANTRVATFVQMTVSSSRKTVLAAYTIFTTIRAPESSIGGVP